MQAAEEIEPIDSFDLDEFDEGTEIRTMSDGSVQLKLSLMPPSWATNSGPFQSFATYLASALGTVVTGLDKELFSIPNPLPDTVEVLKNCLLNLRVDFTNEMEFG